MTPKEYLSRYRRLKNEIDAKLEQVEELEELAERVSPSQSGTSCGGQISDKVGRTAAKIVDLQDEIYEDISRLRAVMNEVSSAIYEVKDATLRMVLVYRYINGYTWEKIAVELEFDVRHVYRLHGYALTRIPEKYLKCH